MKKLERKYTGWDTHLDSWIEKLQGREERVGEDTDTGLKMVWSKEDIKDFLGWSESNYQKKDPVQRMTNMGMTVHELTGKGDATRAVVTINNYAWYYLLMRGKGKRSAVTEAYLEHLFTGNGLIELGGVNIAATLMEFGEKYGAMFGETATAAKRKLDRIREPLAKAGYILNGKESHAKMIRVKVRGSQSWLKGPRAILLDQKLRRDYVDFYIEMDEKLPIRKSDTWQQKKRVKQLRDDIAKDFTKGLCKHHKLDLIRSHHASTLSQEAHADYNAIICLYMMGATFEEIRSFLSERPDYYQEKVEQDKERGGKSIAEIIAECI